MREREEMQNQQYQTRQLVSDYLGWRLAKEGFLDWSMDNRVEMSKNGKTRICMIMRQMGYEFEKRYNSDYLPLLGEHTATSTYLNEMLPLVFAELFQIKPFDSSDLAAGESCSFSCNWCRIVALFAYAGCLSVRCFKSDRLAAIQDIADWIIKFLNCDKRLFDWIEKQGGWDGFIEFFTDEKINIIRNSATNNGHHCSNPSIDKQGRKVCSSETDDECQEIDQSIEKNYQPSPNQVFYSNAKNIFCNVSQVMAITLSSIGIIAIGLIHIGRR